MSMQDREPGLDRIEDLKVGLIPGEPERELALVLGL